MKLNLKRPLAFFDLEATGINVGADRIVEIAILKAMPDGSELVKTWRVNPEMPIPLQTSLIHGIYDEDIANEPTFKTLAAEIAEFIGESDLAGYNSNKFDIPMLLEEFLRAEVDFDMNNRKFVDVQNIFHQMEQRTLKAAYKFYCQEDLINAHAAEADVIATYKVLLGQLEMYKETEFESKQGVKSIPVVNDVDALHIFTNINKPVDFAGRLVYNDNDEVCFNFGKHKGKTTAQVFSVEPSYYAWMKQGDFPLYTKKKLDEEWAKFNARKNENKAAKPQNNAPANKPQYQQKPQPKQEKPAQPINTDMLEQLKMKFGK
ncbi:DNA polymerase III subunit epsilon [Pedobacter ginsenosidimutans]|uniref:DNA polymerase III subunit epsilon n=1 Tax=Pedobacter ginsenosidimutans TaxID=687842 RepID=A0A0T5VGS0_9SPHI|nr:3'-5' exonuclease [Pedobacter ginsenosidimutans]KRT13070.1 DNA polymerase III subunit epsilon [Pedobacter ginsenosidimutans]